MALADDRAELTVVNLSATERREVLVQAGGMGEHEFTEVEVDKERVTVGSETLGLALPPQTQVRLGLGMTRFVHEPSLAPLWGASAWRLAHKP